MNVHRRENVGPDVGQGGGRRTFRGSWGAERLWKPPSTATARLRAPFPGGSHRRLQDALCRIQGMDL